MQTYIRTLFIGKKGYSSAGVFSYCTQGLPGIEIVGGGSAGRNIKEKLIYLSKSLNIKIPMKRYVLCLETTCVNHRLSIDSLRYFELPLLLSLWFLAEKLPIGSLDDCYASGHLTLNNQIHHLSIPPEVWLKIIQEDNLNQTKLKYIGHDLSIVDENLFLIPAQDLLGPFGLF